MIAAIRTMLRCHWSARRIQRYLDADPAAPLSPSETRKLAEHLDICARCTAAADEYRGLRRSLLRWSQRHPVDPAAVRRLGRQAERLITEDLP